MSDQKFPHGKLNEHDEGAVNMSITTDNGCVIVAFEEPTAWFGMPRTMALQFADAVRKHALSLPEVQ